MIGYTTLLNAIETQLKEDLFCKTVTEGSIFNVGLEKQSIYPVAHVEIYGFKQEGAALVYSIAVICMDIVQSDGSNEKDVINVQSAVCLRLAEMLKRGELYGDKYQVNGEPDFEFFRDKFEHSVAGCTMTISVTVPNEMTIE